MTDPWTLFAPGTLVYWRDDATRLHHGEVEEVPPTESLSSLEEEIRVVREHDGPLYDVRMECLVEMF